MTAIKMKYFFPLSVLLMIAMCGCDSGNYIVEVEITGSIERIVYIADIDTDIDGLFGSRDIIRLSYVFLIQVIDDEIYDELKKRSEIEN